MKYDKKEKILLIHRFEQGESASSICSKHNIPRSTFYGWIQQKQRMIPIDDVPLTKKEFKKLQNKTARLEGIIDILKLSPCTATAPLKERLNSAVTFKNQYNIHMICEALNLDRGTFYNHIFRNKKSNTEFAKKCDELRPLIQVIYNEGRQLYGAGKITAVLRHQGHHISEKTVTKLMHEMGLYSMRNGAKAYYLKNQPKVNILQQNFNAVSPNQVWTSDVTYFKYNHKAFYICVIMDLFSRKIIAHHIAFSNSTQLIKATFNLAYDSRTVNKDLIFHSDQGANYTSKTFQNLLFEKSVIQSFSTPGVPYDNSVTEAFFAILKREELYRKNYQSQKDVINSIRDYIYFYNDKRPHKAIKYKTPNQHEAEYADK